MIIYIGLCLLPPEEAFRMTLLSESYYCVRSVLNFNMDFSASYEPYIAESERLLHLAGAPSVIYIIDTLPNGKPMTHGILDISFPFSVSMLY